MNEITLLLADDKCLNQLDFARLVVNNVKVLHVSPTTWELKP